MTKYKTTYRGRPLSEYSKEELIKIIEEMVQRDARLREEQQRNLDILMGTR